MLCLQTEKTGGKDNGQRMMLQVQDTITGEIAGEQSVNVTITIGILVSQFLLEAPLYDVRSPTICHAGSCDTHMSF
jgi:hypothetical protein